MTISLTENAAKQIQTQLAKGRVQVHLERRCPRRKRGHHGSVIRPRAHVLGIIAARLLSGSLQGQLQGGGIEDRRLGVGHGQHQRDPTRQRRSRAAVVVFFVGCAGLAQVNVGVNQAGNF